ncbi:hypothetical protein ACN47E_008892 [Coniothyrium glycines]
MSSFKVIIIGGGLSGGLLANGLLNNNIDFMVYERDHNDSKREGYQIRLGDGAQAGFRACLTPTQLEAIMSKLGKSTVAAAQAPSIFTTQFKEIIDLSSIPNYAKSAAINRVVLRDILLSYVKDVDRIRYGKAFVKYTTIQDSGRERVCVEFADGTTDICDLLVAADGAYSKINKQIGLDSHVRLDSHWFFLSKGKLPHDRMMELPAKLRQGPIMVTHKNTLTYYALYLPEGSSHSDAAGGTAGLEYDEQAASFYWCIIIPVADLPYKNISEIEDSDKRKIVLNQLKTWAPEFTKMYSVGSEDPDAEITIVKSNASIQPRADWRVQASRTDPEKGNPRVWLMGDAIHAMQPNRGQGGNQALYDCGDMLPQIIRLASISASSRPCTTSDYEEACSAYERVMLPRAFAWVKKSGGTTIPNFSLDGWLGVLVRAGASLVVPLIRTWYSVFGSKDAH